MKPYTCLSSEHYPLEIADLLCLDDTPDAKQIEGEAVVLLVGNQQKGIPDTLYQGRGYLLQQQKKGKKEVPARVAFHRTRPWWDILAAFCKPYRKHFFASGTNIYHIDPFAIRAMGLERQIRTKENSYNCVKWNLPQAQREKQYNELKASLEKNGYSDKYPLEIMLCRSLGVKDSLQQGHHRMMFCIEMGIRRCAIKFVNVSHAPWWSVDFLRRHYHKKGAKNG